MSEHVKENGNGVMEKVEEVVDELPSAEMVNTAAPQTQRQKLLQQIESLSQQFNNAKFNMNENLASAETWKGTMLQAQGALAMAQEFLKDFPEAQA